MAMLAERKKKQKWSTDPRNTNWSNGEIFHHIEISKKFFAMSCLFVGKILQYAFGRAVACSAHSAMSDAKSKQFFRKNLLFIFPLNAFDRDKKI